MISRRILRVKVMQAAYAYFMNNIGDINKFEKELSFSIQKSYDLYHYLFVLPIDIINYAVKQIDIARKKYRPTHEDLNPNTRFVENRLIEQLRHNDELIKYAEQKKLSWNNYPELIKNVYHNFINSEHYEHYMNADNISYQDDKKIIQELLLHHIQCSELLETTLEEQSIFWNDELEFMISMIEKTIKKFTPKSNANQKLLPLFKNEEDKEFARRLFRKLILNHTTYKDLIKKYSQNWDIERIALMDVLLMQIAIAEAIEFPSIPTRVTLNEYLELAKFYSTNKSSVFLNGILDRIFNYLKAENVIVKKGRGLIGEA